ncbi:MAG TPA: DegT/DnrJ/EryC1/StrS family aminotransferase [Kiritimatiellia bacterium]|nr:DegT/DnrJ/EryC1/StrS family aminotransferase [Kiritimatiellia bacterium]HRT05051.1 DegT/DnrJ/EryC1/StrS family aminotransferase [Kiritimatiellia bacterium]
MSSTKKQPSDLACCGGQPLFAEKLYVGRPNLCAREKLHAALDQIFDNRWLTNDGPFLRRFEEKLQAFLGVRHVVAVCNATIGLQMVYRALGRADPARRKALMPAFTFIATAHAWEWEGGVPVFCDVDPDRHLLAPAEVAARLDGETGLIVGVHTWGQPCRIDELEALARARKIPLVFDSAHAFSNFHGSRRIGGFGNAEVFSFHATKFFNTFEGGAIATNDDALDAELRHMRNFGFAGYDQVARLGTNGKMQEISAAMGLCLLDEIDGLLETNRRNYRAYREAFAGLPGISLLALDQPDTLNCQYIVGELAPELPAFARDLLVDVLWAENVIARKYFHPGCHRSAPYAARAPIPALPVTDDLCRRVVVFPAGAAVSSDSIRQIAETVRFVLEHADDVQRQRKSRA